MSVKHFCDVCGEPAMDASYEYALPKPIPDGTSWDKKVVYVDASSHWKIGQPRQSDSISDICKSRMVVGLEKIIEKLKGAK
jgi:hypothetical protein